MGLKMTYYNGVQLKVEEVHVLKELEESIGQPIPCKGIGFYRTGFVHEGQSVIGLSLRQQKLKALPETIRNLTNLQRLYLRDNELTTLPETIGELKQLQNLDVFNNQIQTLPDSIGDLPNLWRFDLSRNQIPRLPHTIGQLKSLKRYLKPFPALFLPLWLTFH